MTHWEACPRLCSVNDCSQERVLLLNCLLDGEAYGGRVRKCPPDTVHRQVKYLNNIIEADHGKLKRLINPVRGFKSMKTAYATLKGFELMRMFKKGQLDMWKYGQDLTGEIRLIERQFGIYST